MCSLRKRNFEKPSVFFDFFQSDGRSNVVMKFSYSSEKSSSSLIVWNLSFSSKQTFLTEKLEFCKWGCVLL